MFLRALQTALQRVCKRGPSFEGHCRFRPGGWYMYNGESSEYKGKRFQFLQFGEVFHVYDSVTSYAFVDDDGLDATFYDSVVSDTAHQSIEFLSPIRETLPDDLSPRLRELVEQLLYGTSGERASAAYVLGCMGHEAESALPWLQQCAAHDTVVIYRDRRKWKKDTPRHVAKEAIEKIMQCRLS